MIKVWGIWGGWKFSQDFEREMKIFNEKIKFFGKDVENFLSSALRHFLVVKFAIYMQMRKFLGWWSLYESFEMFIGKIWERLWKISLKIVVEDINREGAHRG
jgi:hypothetical protein